MNGYFFGEYFNTLDEKGRIAFPSKLKEILNDDKIWITKGMDNDKCLLIYPQDEWERTVKELESRIHIYTREARWIYRRFISPAREVIIDKNGRIAIPQSLREYANLKKDCLFLGMNKVIELWDVEIFNNEEKKASDNYINSFEELGKIAMHSSKEL